MKEISWFNLLLALIPVLDDLIDCLIHRHIDTLTYRKNYSTIIVDCPGFPQVVAYSILNYV